LPKIRRPQWICYDVEIVFDDVVVADSNQELIECFDYLL
jgi:hypothetical protein